MKLTKKSDYGVRGLIYLARKPEKKTVLTSEVSEAQNIPQSFLNKIFQKLAKAGILRSYRGYGGGFSLAKRPSEITLRRIIEVLEGPIKLKRREPEVEVESDSSLALTSVWEKVQKRLNKILERTTVSDLLKRVRKVEKRKQA
ncbi:MAG: transcriptional regulator, BadM/Rrf2 family [uncultured bacterium]|nr:MAG: transcriptional regulator, BadM/Rrf2 family [uncultured bacterium]